MDSALCTINNKLYSAVEFAQLAPPTLEEYRRALICNTCGNEAFFRRASTLVRRPCFGARPHVEGCVEATIDAGTWGAGGNADGEPIVNNAARIVIDLPRLDGANDAAEQDGAEELRRGAGRVYNADGAGAGVNATHRRLSTLLRTLYQDRNFQYSEATVTPPGTQENTTVAEFFVRFDLARERALHEFKGLWGPITDASYDYKDDLWLNTGPRENTVSFVISKDIEQRFLERWRVTDIEQFAGAQALILTTTSVSGNGKMYGRISDLRYVALDLA